MVTKNEHHGLNSAIQKPNPGPECMPKMQPFFDNMGIYQGMADSLETNVDFLLALSSMESGWLDPHNQSLHNLFGVTKAGGNNLFLLPAMKRRPAFGSSISVLMSRAPERWMILPKG